MEYSTELDPSLPASTLTLPRRWDERLARWISNLLNPPLLALVGIALATWQIHTPVAWAWAGYYVGITVLIPIGYLLWKIERGEISDFHIYRREQRIKPMTLTLASATFAWASMWAGGAPWLLTLFAGIGIFQIAFFLLVTFNWKISGHGTAISSLAMLLWAIYGGVGATAFLAVPLVGWARIRLRRHTFLQTLAGSLSGILFMVIVLYLVSLHCHGFDIACQP